MLLTNQKTINYENLLRSKKAYDDLNFASANVEVFLELKKTFLHLTFFWL